MREDLILDFLFSFALFELVEETLEAHHREGDLGKILVSPSFHLFDLRFDVGGRQSGNERWKDPSPRKPLQEVLELFLVFFSL